MRSHCPVFCPPVGYTSQLWCCYSTYTKGFQPILFADPYNFPCRQKGSSNKSRTALLRLYRPLGRDSHHCSIYLGSVLNSEAPHLFGSSSRRKLWCFHANLFQAPSACQQYSTAYTPLNTNTIQNTSLPTKCPHRADLQYNYFLLPIIETLRRVQISSQRTPALHTMRRHLIKGG